MHRLELEGKWNQIKGQFKQKYGQLINDDEAFAEGKFEEIIGKVQESAGKTRKEIEKEIEDWKA